MSDKIVSKTILVNAPVAAVWQIIAEPAEIKKWLTDSGEIDVDFQKEKGSPVRFAGTLHGHEYFAKGTILDFIPGKLFRYNSWNKIEELPDEPENYSVFEFRLEDAAGQTMLHFQHSNLRAKAQYEHSEMYWNVTMKLIKQAAEK